ncbi:MAG: hypothetical protein IPO18_08895 [bacterium]|nr:hypothetical protein [bacterium]
MRALKTPTSQRNAIMTHNVLASIRVGLRQASVSRTRRLTGLLGGLLCIAMLTIAGALLASRGPISFGRWA